MGEKSSTVTRLKPNTKTSLQHNTFDTFNNFMKSAMAYPQKASSLVFFEIQIITSVVFNHHFTLQFAVLRHCL